MKICAIICEYNPFHNGHKYQIEEIKKEHDAVICIMSGAFVQRGDAAIFDKWTRAECALLNGVDLVIELPVCFSVNTAERFSFGAISILDKLGVVNSLCFGSECGDIDILIKAEDILANEPYEVSEYIKKLLDKGISYPKARSIAFSSFIDEGILTEPNNILALEYIHALKSLNSTISPITLKRKDAGHHDISLDKSIASATAIRSLIRENKDFSTYVPENTYALYKTSPIADISRLDTALIYILRTTPPEILKKINDVTEGLENRLINSAYECSGFHGLCKKIKTKRYTYTKLSRILVSVLLYQTKELSKSAPGYVRVLGMNSVGMDILSDIKKKSSLQIITKPSDFKNFNASFKLDIKSGDIYSLCFEDNDKNMRDYYNSPIIKTNG
ncbi:MAG: nucleotidyltransferase [Clostridia bacterium]|nr:nucleotidyltransferase [Clostridia bacterium]